MVKTPRRNHWRQGSLHHSKVSFIPNIGASQLEEVRHVTDTSKHVGTILNDSLGNRRVVSENFLVPNFCGTRFQINIKIEKQFDSYHDWIPNEFGRGQILITSPLFYFQDYIPAYVKKSVERSFSKVTVKKIDGPLLILSRSWHWKP